MQIDETTFSVVWSCVFTAMGSGVLLYKECCHLSLIVHIHKTFWTIKKSVMLSCNSLYGVWFIRLFSEQEIKKETWFLNDNT